MSFLAPLFLLGAAAIALPVIFHLIRRTTRERTVFSSLLFLQPTPPRLSRRSRIEHLLLLLLRCLVLCLLAVGFARPLLQKPPEPTPPGTDARRLLLLVDSSASMRRSALWSDARAKMASILDKTSPVDQVALYNFDRQTHSLVSFEQWNSTPAGERIALATRKLSEATPGWSSTHLGNALIRAAEDLADSSGNSVNGQIVLITDLKEGSHLDGLQGYEWPRGITLSVEVLKPKQPGNAGLQLLTDSEHTDSPSDATVRLRVSNTADSRQEQFKVGWATLDGLSFSGEPLAVYVPPGQSRIVKVPLPSAGGAADRILLKGDEADFDNTVFVTRSTPTRLTVLYLGSDLETDPKQPLYFLKRAFQETRRQAVQVVARAPVALLQPEEVQRASLFVVADALTEPNAKALREQLVLGKTALCVLLPNVAAPSLARLLAIERLDLEEVRPANYAMLGEIDFRHPLFAPFADPRFSDFTKIHFWQYRRLDAAAIPGARIVAKFDGGDPALLEVPVGKGHLFILASGWQPEESQLALSTKFVPLLYSLLESCGVTASAPLQYSIGEVVPLTSLATLGSSPVVVRTPDGSQMNLAPGETNFTLTTMPGIYSITSEPPQQFAINVDPAESRTTPLPGDELERLGAPLSRDAPQLAREIERKIQWQQAELENRQKLWRWFILGAIAVLLLETWLAGRAMRQRLETTSGIST